jgi:rubrerythrin
MTDTSPPPPLDTNKNVDQVIRELQRIEATIQAAADNAKLHLSKHSKLLKCSLEESTKLMKRMEEMQQEHADFLQEILKRSSSSTPP